MALQFDSVLLYGLNKYAHQRDRRSRSPRPARTTTSSTPASRRARSSTRATRRSRASCTRTPGDWLYFLTVTGGKSEFSATPLSGQ